MRGGVWQGLSGTRKLDSEGALDGELHALATGAATRLELGRLLHHLQRRRGFAELGFPSLKAYATQRCVQGSRCAHEALRLARILFDKPGLPRVAGALDRGQISWSMAQELARYLRWYATCPEIGPRELSAREQLALEASLGQSVRAMREQLGTARRLDESTDRAMARAAALDGEDVEGSEDGEGSEGAEGLTYAQEDDDREYLALERTIPMHEVWVLEAARNYLGAVMGEDVSDETFLDALTVGVYDCVHNADGARVDALMCKLDELHVRRARADAERARRARAREKAEATAEGLLEFERNRAGKSSSGPDAEPAPPVRLEPIEWAAVPEDARALDRCILASSRDMAEAELRMCVLAHEFGRCRGWSAVGYASQAHYARERLGMSRQAFSELRRRGQAFAEFPELLAAVKFRRIGMVAAMHVARIATPDTVDGWIARACARTVLALEQEVTAVETAVRCGLDDDLGPPAETLLGTVAEFERMVLEGAVWQDAIDRIMNAANGVSNTSVAPDGASNSGSETADGQQADDVRMSVCGDGSEAKSEPGPGPSAFDTPGMTVRFVVPVDAADAFEDAERLHAYAERLDREAAKRRSAKHPRMSLLAQLSLVLLNAMKVDPDLLDGKWSHIYLRDRYRCQNPVCGTRKTVTPHHMRFQSHGGGHEDENLVTLCPTCHLEMVHERRSLVVEPPASNTRWLIGGREDALLEVVGRELVCREAG